MFLLISTCKWWSREAQVPPRLGRHHMRSKLGRGLPRLFTIDIVQSTIPTGQSRRVGLIQISQGGRVGKFLSYLRRFQCVLMMLMMMMLLLLSLLLLLVVVVVTAAPLLVQCCKIATFSKTMVGSTRWLLLALVSELPWKESLVNRIPCISKTIQLVEEYISEVGIQYFQKIIQQSKLVDFGDRKDWKKCSR